MIRPHSGFQPHKLVQAIPMAGGALSKVLLGEGMRVENGPCFQLHLAHGGVPVEPCVYVCGGGIAVCVCVCVCGCVCMHGCSVCRRSRVLQKRCIGACCRYFVLQLLCKCFVRGLCVAKTVLMCASVTQVYLLIPTKCCDTVSVSTAAHTASPA